MAELTKEEKALMKSNTSDKLKSKELKIPFFFYWTKEYYLKTYTPKGYPDGKGLKTKDGQKTKRLPRWKLGLNGAKWWMPFFLLLIIAVIILLVFMQVFKDLKLEWKDYIGYLFKTFKDPVTGNVVWNGPLTIISITAFVESLWFLFYYGFKFIFYFPYRKKEMNRKSVIEIQSKNLKKNRIKYGTLSYEELLPSLGPKKDFNVTVLDDPATLHGNMGWIIKCGITNNPTEISLARKGYISKRMWEERPDDIINKYIEAFGKNSGIPDKNYIFYVVTSSVNKLHCFSEGETGSGKTECYASPESIFVLRDKSHPSVLFTCKAGDEKSTVDQAKCLDVKVQHIKLNDPGSSDSFNPLYIPFLYHKLKRQLKYTTQPKPMSITPWDWENQYDVEIRQKANKAVNIIPNISSKEQLIEELAKYTSDVTVENLLPNWKEPAITLQDMVNVYRSWEDQKWMIVDIKKHFLLSNRLEFWTESKKKTTNRWYKVGNWIFESVEDFMLNKESLLAKIEGEFTTQVDSVITNVMNEEKNKSTDAFWNNQARIFLKMMVNIYFDLIEMGDFSNNTLTMSDAYFNLPTICMWLNNYCQSVDKIKELLPFAEQIRAIEDNKANFANVAEQTFSSITGSINAITQFYDVKSDLLPIITRNDFNPLDFGLRQMLLCITTNNDEAAKANMLLKDVVSQTINCCNFICNNYKDGAGKSTMPRPVRIIADEAGSGAPIPWNNINAIATKGRSQKILEGLYYQTIKQIHNQYPTIEGAEESMFGNMSLQRCIKSKAEDSLKKWEGILGRGLATTLSDEDKKAELAGSTPETAYFPAEYIRNKPQWNSLIKIGELKTIDVSSCPLFPTYFKKQIAVEAKKHEPKAYKKRVTTTDTFRQNNYIDLEVILNTLSQTISENYNFCILFNDLLSEERVAQNGSTQIIDKAFAIRFSPKSNLQNFTTNLDNFASWEKVYDQETAIKFDESDQSSEGSQSEDTSLESTESTTNDSIVSAEDMEKAFEDSDSNSSEFSSDVSIDDEQSSSESTDDDEDDLE